MTADDAPQPFLSYASMRIAHSDLLRRHRESGDTPEILIEVEEFIRRGQATGALLDTLSDRQASQSLLDYWATMLYRARRDPPDPFLAEFDPRLAPELDNRLCPYLGLDAFQESDEQRFFGRQRLIEELVDRIKDHRVLAVVGPSGSGKSSLVRAGLVPALRSGALPNSQHWRYCPPILPGSEPLISLARLTLPQGGEITERIGQLIEHIEQDPGYIARRVGEIGEMPAVVIVDQFEEVFTLCSDENVRQAFINNLLSLSQSPNARHTVILTMRSDFESYVARMPSLQPLFEQGQVRVTPLNASELREAIERPAELIGLKFEAGVVDALLQDILGEPAALPLLQFTLRKLWDHREHNRVTLEAYHRLGGGRLALARSADAFYDELIPEEQITAKRILLRMVRPSEGLEVTSSRIRRNTLYQIGEAPDRLDRVLDKLIHDAGLVRLTKGDTPDDDQVEVAHEALVRNWPRLVDWLADERVELTTRQRLEAKADEWVRLGQGSSGLLDEVQLLEAERWLSSPDAAYLGYKEILPAFVGASRTAIEEATQERETARQRELSQAQALAKEQARTSNLLRWLAVALVTVALLAVMVAVLSARSARLARGEQQQAQAEADIRATEAAVRGTAEAKARANEQLAATRAGEAVAAQATTEALRGEAETARAKTEQGAEAQALAFRARTALDPELGLLRAIEAAKRDKNELIEDVLRQAIQDSHVRMRLTHTSGVYSAIWSADGMRILTACENGVAYVWEATTGQQLAVLQGHAKKVNNAVWSPDERYILTASDDQTARVWEASSGKELLVLRGHTGPVNSALWSLDGQQILTASNDGTVRIWNATTAQPIITLPVHNGHVLSAAWSPDGQRILTSSADRTARVWDVATGKELIVLRGHTAVVNSAVWSPDGQRILTASDDRTARVWDAANGKELLVLRGHNSFLSRAVWSPDGQRILTSSADRTARVWDVATGKELIVLRGHDRFVSSAVWSTDARRVLTASADGTARIWDISPGNELLELKGHTDIVRTVVLDPDGQRILTASADETARVWNATTGTEVLILRGHKESLHSAAWSPDGQRILTSSADGTARIWDASTGEQRVTLPGHIQGVTTALWRSDGQAILTASDTGKVWVWDATNGNVLLALAGHRSHVWSAVWSPDERYILTASDDQTARVWDATTGNELLVLRGHMQGVRSAIWSQDGQRILTASADGTARVWDASNGRELLVLSGHEREVNDVVLSPDEQRILTFSNDKTARVWDAHTGKEIAVLRGHEDVIRTATWSHDGKHILTASWDKTARVWDALSGAQLSVLRGNEGGVEMAAWSSDDRRILTAGQDGTVHIYYTDFSDVLALAESRVTRQLTLQEQQESLNTPLLAPTGTPMPTDVPGATP